MLPIYLLLIRLLLNCYRNLGVSGGVQVVTSNHVFVGAGYNSVRGVNGQVGVKF